MAAAWGDGLRPPLRRKASLGGRALGRPGKASRKPGVPGETPPGKPTGRIVARPHNRSWTNPVRASRSRSDSAGAEGYAGRHGRTSGRPTRIVDSEVRPPV